MHSILPQHCVLCGAASFDRLLCAGCDADLSHYSVAACPICALPAPGGQVCPTPARSVPAGHTTPHGLRPIADRSPLAGFPLLGSDHGETRGLRPATSHETGSCGIVCGACLQRPPAFDRTLAAFSYEFPIDRLLHAFKYAGNLALAEVLAEPLARLVAAQPKPDLLLPMPLHPARLRERGFNQSLEIAKPVSRWLDIPLAANGCRRTRDTPTQARLKWKERRRNVRGAFACDLDLAGKKVAVLDDVMTTGATLDEISRVLRGRGAIEVSAWVVARTLPE